MRVHCERSQLKILPIVSCFKMLTYLFLCITVEVTIEALKSAVNRPINIYYGGFISRTEQLYHCNTSPYLVE